MDLMQKSLHYDLYLYIEIRALALASGQLKNKAGQGLCEPPQPITKENRRLGESLTACFLEIGLAYSMMGSKLLCHYFRGDIVRHS